MASEQDRITCVECGVSWEAEVAGPGSTAHCPKCGKTLVLFRKSQRVTPSETLTELWAQAEATGYFPALRKDADGYTATLYADSPSKEYPLEVCYAWGKTPEASLAEVVRKWKEFCNAE